MASRRLDRLSPSVSRLPPYASLEKRMKLACLIFEIEKLLRDTAAIAWRKELWRSL